MPRLTKDERLRRTAYHEAGHAVACLSLRRAFKDVSIISTEDSEGRLIHRDWGTFEPDLISYDWVAEDVKRIRRRTFIALAGSASEWILTGRRLRGRWESPDYTNILKKIDRLYAGAMGLDSDTDKMFTHYIEYMEYAAKHLLRVNWVHVTTIANTLLKEKSLTYNQIKILTPQTIPLDAPTDQIEKFYPITRARFL